ncbi:hypothetical protein KW805_03775 [Candidatus Pacearchaeota archaeon]|nr:hypothetical protein [Candidatus Pacearchaeota archaeon]
MKFASIFRISAFAVFVLAVIFSMSNAMAANKVAKLTIDVTFVDNYQPLRSLDPSDASDKVFVGNSETPVGHGIVTIFLTNGHGVPITDEITNGDVPGLHVRRGRDSTGQYFEFTSFGMHIIEEQRESIKFNIKLTDATINEAVNGPSTKTYENAQDGTCGITEDGGAIDDDSNNDEYSVNEGRTTGSFCSVVSGKIDQVRVYYDVIPIVPLPPPVCTSNCPGNNTNQTNPGNNQTNQTNPGNNTNTTNPGNNQTNHTNPDITPPIITNVHVTPPLMPPFQFNLTIQGTETCQDFNITFDSNEYPLNITISLFKANDGLVAQVFYPINNAGEIPELFVCPMNLPLGTYNFTLTAEDKAGNTAVPIFLGQIIVFKDVIGNTTIPGNNTNSTNPGNNQTNTTTPGHNPGGSTTKRATKTLSAPEELPTPTVSHVLDDEEEQIVLNQAKLVAAPKSSSGLWLLVFLMGSILLAVILLLVLVSRMA